MISRDKVFEMVAKERDRQDAKWGFPQHNSPFEWVSIVTEELGELAKETNDAYIGKNPKRNVSGIMREAIHVAAVAIAIIEHLPDGLEEKQC